MPVRSSNQPARVLVVQTAFLGDVVLSIPLLMEIRRLLPGSELWVLTAPCGAEIVAAVPGVDRVLVLDKRWTPQGLATYARVVFTLLRARFAVAVGAQRSFRTGVLLCCSRAPLRIGFAGAAGAWAYCRRVHWDPSRHARMRYLDLVGPLGGDPDRADPQATLVVDPAARARIGGMMSNARLAGAPYACVAPGSERGAKRWTPEGFAGVVDALAARGIPTVLIGSSAERALCEHVAALSARPSVVLAGRTSISDLVALLADAEIFVGNDSGPSHVAAALGVPVVAVFGPTVPTQGYGPGGPSTRIVERLGLGCRPCGRRAPRSCPLGHFRCMREIGAEAVVRQVDGLLGDVRHGTRPG